MDERETIEFVGGPMDGHTTIVRKEVPLFACVQRNGTWHRWERSDEFTNDGARMYRYVGIYIPKS